MDNRSVSPSGDFVGTVINQGLCLLFSGSAAPELRCPGSCNRAGAKGHWRWKVRCFPESKQPWYRTGATEDVMYLSHPCLPDFNELRWRSIHQGGILCPGRALPLGERQHGQGGGQEGKSSSLNNRQPRRRTEEKADKNARITALFRWEEGKQNKF